MILVIGFQPGIWHIHVGQETTNEVAAIVHTIKDEWILTMYWYGYASEYGETDIFVNSYDEAVALVEEAYS